MRWIKRVNWLNYKKFVSTDMTTNSPLAVKYPFVTDKCKDYTELDKLLDAQSHGFYLIGRNDYWHGGIDITDEKSPITKLPTPSLE